MVVLVFTTSSALATAADPVCGSRAKTEAVESIEDEKFLGPILQKALEDLMERLNVKDDVEKQLLFEAMRGKTVVESTSPNSVTIVFVRPSKTKETRDTFEVRIPDHHLIIKMVKIRSASVVEPVGVIVNSAAKDGQMIVDESVLHFRKGKWRHADRRKDEPDSDQ
jgi:hypothetical protein